MALDFIAAWTAAFGSDFGKAHAGIADDAPWWQTLGVFLAMLAVPIGIMVAAVLA